MVAGYAVLGVYARSSPGAGTLFAHVAYLPIVMASIWWGRRAIVLAAGFAAFTVGVASGPADLTGGVMMSAVFVAIAWLVGDFSDRKAAVRRSLGSSEAKNRLLITKSPIGIFVHQAEKVTFSNPLFERMRGYSSEELAGRSIWSLIAEEDHVTVRGLLSRNALYMVENQAGSLDDVTENLRLIDGQVDRAANIIHRMQDLLNRHEREFTACDVNRILGESVEFFMPQFDVSHIAVTVDLDGGVSPMLGDRIRLEQLFINLLTNARNAMSEAPVRRLRVASRFEPGDRLGIVVQVSDTGRGFPPEEAQKIFTPFHTAGQPDQTTGLGLSVAFIIAKEHGGMIEAEGRPGEGATFTVRFPPQQNGVSEAMGTNA